MMASVDPVCQLKNGGFEEVLYALNGLPTESTTRKEILKTGLSSRVKSDVERHLRTLGIEVSDLDKLNIIHVAGTKGKGSTCFFCESILRKHGFKTGFYSTPHLVSVTERMRINGLPLDRNLFITYFWEVYNSLEESMKDGETMPNYIIFTFVMAIYVFVKEQVQATVIEVGIGGLYDRTNIMKKPIVVGVTFLELDHVQVLGGTIEEIASQKAGIFKPGVPAFTYCQDKSAMKVLCEKAKEIGCPLILAPPLEDYKQDIKLNVPSVIQYTNASLALQLTYTWLKYMSCNDYSHLKDILKSNSDNEQLSLPVGPTFPIDDKFKEGLDSFVCPGRSQIIKKDGLTLYLDTAHTKQSMTYCAEWFQDVSMKERKLLQDPVLKVLIFNCRTERNSERLLTTLIDLDFDLVVFSPHRMTEVKSPYSDEFTRLYTLEEELEHCRLNEKTWCHLRSLRENEQREAMTQRYAAVSDSSEKSSVPNENSTIIFCCLGIAVNWLLYRKKVTHCALCDKSNSLDEILKKVGHVQVLTTGSFNLVGNMMVLTGTDV